MANGNFIVQNGLTVGGVTIDATSGNITTSGVLSTTNTSYPAVFNDLTIAGNIISTGTGYFDLPVGTTAQRPLSPNLGMVRYNTTTSSYEGYGAGSAWSSLGGVKSVDGKAYISAEITAGDATDVLRFYAGDSGSSTQVMWASTSNINIPVSTSTTSPTTGALQVAGGVGIAGNLQVGGTVLAPTIGNVNSALVGTVSTVSQPSVTTMAGLTSFGTAGVNTTAAGHFVVAGNLTVQGNTVTINSATLSIQDPIINLGTATDLAPLVAPTTTDIGIKMHYYDTADSAAFLGRENSSSTLVWYSRGTDTANVFTGTVLGNVKIGSLFVANTTNSTSTTTGAVQIAGGVGIAGNVFTAGWVVPTANTSQNLGSTTNYWNNIYGINFFGTSTTAKYADLAENYQADSQYSPGQVVEFGGTREVTLGTADSTAVAGVVSTNPAHLMNGGLNGPNVVAIALQGRVPCNVIGPVKKGQLMISAGFGFAKPSVNPQVGQVIGKALQDFDGAKGQIEVVVGRC